VNDADKVNDTDKFPDAQDACGLSIHHTFRNDPAKKSHKQVILFSCALGIISILVLVGTRKCCVTHTEPRSC
jgi:hypothetical protein